MIATIPVSEVKRRGLSVASVSDLRAIYLSKLKFDAELPLIDGQFGVSANLSYGVRRGVGGFIVVSTYALSARSEVGETAWNVALELMATWDIADEADRFDLIDYHSFAVTVGVMTLHPFARETVHNVTARTG
jgi:hypothetical protein